MVAWSDVTVYHNFIALDLDSGKEKMDLLYTMIVQDSTTYSDYTTLKQHNSCMGKW